MRHSVLLRYAVFSCGKIDKTVRFVFTEGNCGLFAPVCLETSMIRALAFLAIVTVASFAQAATVTFTGTFNITLGPDVLGISNRSFVAFVNTVGVNGTPGVGQTLGSHITFEPNTVNANTFSLGSGDIVLGGGTSSFRNIAAAGGLLRFDINQQLPNPFTQDDFNVMAQSLPGGTGVWVVGGTTYIASAITAVPEPSSAIALGGLLCGSVALMRRRKN